MRKILLLFMVIILAVTQSFSQENDYSKFRGKKVNLNQITQINTPFIFDYQINSSNGLDSLLYGKVKGNSAEKILTENHEYFFLKNETQKNNFLKLKYKFTFENQGNLISIIKYNEVKDSIISLPKTLVLKKLNNQWKKTDSENIKSIEYVVKNLNIDSFWQFYNAENNQDYPEINKLKPLVQDSNGILNIEKLGKVIKENQSVLSKYLDN